MPVDRNSALKGARTRSRNGDLVAFEERDNGWYAVYSNGMEYRHDTENEAKSRHRDLLGVAKTKRKFPS